MNINQIIKLQKVIKKILFSTIILISPYISNAQFGNGPCNIIDTVVIEGFCWDPSGSTGVVTIVPGDINPIYNYAVGTDTVFAYDSLGIFYNYPLDSVFVGVVAGTYTVWLQEVNNPFCFDTITIVIPDPQDSITTVTNVSNNLICYGDSTGGGEVNAIGGVLPYTYLWLSTGATTNVVSNLWAGYHYVNVTDGNGCVAVDSILIENIYDPLLVQLDTLQQVQCYGECNGAVALDVTRGVAPYTFNWSTGQNYFGPGPDTLLGLCQGGHQVLISDAYGCDTVVSFIISEPSQLYAAADVIQHVQCFGYDDGQALVIGTGGTGTGNPNDYTYNWSFIQDFNTLNADTIPTGVVNDTTNNDSDPDLVPGVHYVIITDTNGCVASDTVTITEPTQLHVEIPDSSAIYSYCLNTYSGSLVAQAYGGTPFSSGLPYSYSWDNTAQLTDSVYGLHADIHTVTVFDDRGCTASATFDLDSITNTFISDSVDVMASDVTCYALYDGFININGISGSDYPPYNYNWTGPPPFISINSPVVNGLYEGNYAVTIVDSLGCTMSVNVDILQPAKLEFGVAATVNESCVGVTGSSCNGNIILNIDGGTSPYFYDNSFSGVFPILASDQVLVVNDTLMSGFCNGIYNIDITDVNGCQGYVDFGASFTANVGSDVQVVNPGIDPAVPTTSCFNTADGMAHVLGGADPLFNYTWQSDNSGSPSGIVLAAGGTYNNLLAGGDYWLVAHYTDPLGFGINYAACDVPYNFYVNPGNMINSGAIVTNPTCYGDSDGSIDLTLVGSTAPPFIFLWDTLSSIPFASCSLEDQSQLAAGLYTVSITDDDGCVLVESISVIEPNPIIANFTINDVTCNGDGDGIATAIVNGGQGTLSYLWSDGQTTNPAQSLSGGDYTVTVTDGLSCSVDFSLTIVEPSPILASVEPNSFWGEDASGNPFHIRCNGEADGSIIVGSVGGTGNVTFAWENSLGITVSTLQEAVNLPAGSYTLYATDANGCVEDTTIVLNEPDVIAPYITESLYDFDEDMVGTEISCFGLFDGWVLSSPTGGYPGSQGYTFNWTNSNGENVSSQDLAANLPALFSYTVTVTDMNNCSESATSVLFTQPLPFNANVTTTNYPGPTQAPFIVNFVDSTSSLDPYTYDWSWEDGNNDMNLEFTPEDIGVNEVYIVLINTVTGCHDTVFFNIDIQGIPEINNVFTPNSDGINDYFFFGEFGMNTVSVEIYNRWGQMVYTWDGADKSWNGIDISGEFVPEGVYFYSLVAEGADGHYYDKKGSVTLLR